VIALNFLTQSLEQQAAPLADENVVRPLIAQRNRTRPKKRFAERLHN
jgi:hypothetical protein